MDNSQLSELCLYETPTVDYKPGSCPTLPFGNHREDDAPPTLTLSFFTVYQNLLAMLPMKAHYENELLYES